MGIRRSEQLVKSAFTTDGDGNPTGGSTTQYTGGPHAPAIMIRWQDGIVGEEGQNGAFVEDVIEAALQRLRFFNDTRFRCRENSLAITALEEAQNWLDRRTRNRLVQDVENTYEVHTDTRPKTVSQQIAEAAAGGPVGEMTAQDTADV